MNKDNLFEVCYDQILLEQLDRDIEEEKVNILGRIEARPVINTTRYFVYLDEKIVAEVVGKHSAQSIMGLIKLVQRAVKHLNATEPEGSVLKYLQAFQRKSNADEQLGEAFELADEANILSGDVTVSKYANTRFFQVTSNGNLIAVTTYRRGAMEIKRIIDLLRSKLRTCEEVNGAAVMKSIEPDRSLSFSA